MDKESAEVQAVRAGIAAVVKARQGHAAIIGLRDTEVSELNALRAQRATIQARLTAREKEIALAFGELPDKPFPEEAEIARLDRHERIRAARVRGHEEKVRESQAAIDELIRNLEGSWGVLGAAISERLLDRFREAVSAIRDVHLEYAALKGHFSRKWNSARWRHWYAGLAIFDPQTAEPILHPLETRDDLAHKWPTSAHSLLKDVDSLRAEINSVVAGGA